MEQAGTMTLPYLPMEDPAFAADPMRFFESARREHPWLAKCSVGFVVHEYQAIREMTPMDDKMRPSMDSISEIMGAKGTAWGDFMDNLMLAKTGEEHTRIRNSVAISFTPRNINRYRALMREVVSRLLDEWAPLGAFDFADFAANFPITVMFGLIGASPSALPGIRKSLETQGLSVSLDKSMLPAVQAAYEVLYDFVDKLVLERQKHPAGESQDVLNSLLAATRDGQIDEAELRNLLIFLFAAGYDTSKNMLTLIMHKMVHHPDLWKRCAVDRDFCDKVVEEMFRINSVSNMYRTVTNEIVYRDVQFPVGSLIVLPLSISGRDPEAFAQPMTFLPERQANNRHVAFGLGKHMCLGQHLARAQIQEGVHLIARRITNPRLTGEATWRPFYGVWGLRTLPIAFDPASG
jgi:cytochrome P450